MLTLHTPNWKRPERPLKKWTGKLLLTTGKLKLNTPNEVNLLTQMAPTKLVEIKVRISSLMTKVDLKMKTTSKRSREITIQTSNRTEVVNDPSTTTTTSSMVTNAAKRMLIVALMTMT